MTDWSNQDTDILQDLAEWKEIVGRDVGMQFLRRWPITERSASAIPDARPFSSLTNLTTGLLSSSGAPSSVVTKLSANAWIDSGIVRISRLALGSAVTTTPSRSGTSLRAGRNGSASTG